MTEDNNYPDSDEWPGTRATEHGLVSTEEYMEQSDMFPGHKPDGETDAQRVETDGGKAARPPEESDSTDESGPESDESLAADLREYDTVESAIENDSETGIFLFGQPGEMVYSRVFDRARESGWHIQWVSTYQFGELEPQPYCYLTPDE